MFKAKYYAERNFGKNVFLEIYLYNLEDLKELSHQLSLYLPEFSDIKEQDVPPFKQIQKKEYQKISEFHSEMEKLYQNAKNSLYIAELAETNFNSHKSKVPHIISLLNNSPWDLEYGKKFEEKNIINELKKLETKLNRSALLKERLENELDEFQSYYSQINNEWEKHDKHKTLKEKRKLLDEIISKKDKLQRLKNHARRVSNTFARDFGTELHGKYTRLANNIKNAISKMERERKHKEKEKSLKKKIIEQIRSLDKGIPIIIQRFSELCEMEHEKCLNKLNSILKDNPKLGTYYEKQQVFIPGEDIASDIDQLLEQFENKGSKKNN